MLLPEKKVLNFPTGFIEVYLDPFSRRIRVDAYRGTPEDVLDQVRNLIPAWTEKIIIKSRPSDKTYFESENFLSEGHIPAYFSGEDMYFLVSYLKEDRSRAQVEFEGTPFAEFQRSTGLIENILIGDIRQLHSSDADSIALIFDLVFEYYPTPMNQPDYVRQTMDEGTIYFGVFEFGKLVSVASAEINLEFGNAELTDCATSPQFTGRGYMQAILQKIQNELLKRKITCQYTLARASQSGINKVFYNLGFKFCGILKQNCCIGTGMEDMAVWVKNFPK